MHPTSTPSIPVAALFVTEDSIYKKLGCDCYDFVRDARSFRGNLPVVAHPPCRAWGKLKHFSKHTSQEKELGPWAVGQVRRWGGVVEHPLGSSLFRDCNCLPYPMRDSFGGFVLKVDQHWFGHNARKTTLLYFCGLQLSDIPPLPLRFEPVMFNVAQSTTSRVGSRRQLPEIPRKEREATPPLFAQWLINSALAASAR